MPSPKVGLKVIFSVVVSLSAKVNRTTLRSFWGPLLFILYTFDLPDVLNACKLLLYADDTCIYSSVPFPAEVVATLNSDLSPLSVWFSENLLKLNTKKIEFVMFPKFLVQKTFRFSRLSLVPSEVSARYLGVHFDSGLCWRPNLNNVFSQVSKKIGILRRCSRNLFILSLFTRKWITARWFCLMSHPVYHVVFNYLRNNPSVF